MPGGAQFRVLLLLHSSVAFAAASTFYADVLPVLENRCQECHRAGQMAPMSLMTYQEVRPWAKAIRENVLKKQMPPWFADPCCGNFSNDRSLTSEEINTLVRWVDEGSPEGDPRTAPSVRTWATGWNIANPDAVFEIPSAFEVPAKGTLDYQYFVVPTRFQEDRWIQASEVRPGDRSVVHHAVVYIREPGDTSFPNATHSPTKADILNVYAPGSSPDVLPQGMGRLVKAGSDLVFEIHYTPSGKRTRDQTRVGVKFAAKPPAKRVLTLQMGNDHFLIPAGDRNFRVTVWGSLPNDALLLGFFPHMHLRGKEFEYTMTRPGGRPETLLRVRPFNFYWQLFYRLATPIPLVAGTRLEWIGTYDNSAANPRNPNPQVDVGYGLQSDQEMMVGFFDIAVDAGVDKKQFFVR